MNAIDLTDKKFGNLIVIKRLNYSKLGHTYLWECKCDCGNTTIVRGTNLKSGHTISCGCKKGKIIHNKWRTRLYRIYANMKQRCNNPKNIWYKNYGARGITICDEWLNDFMNFYNWAQANGYKENLTLDRINVNGNYEPNNCRWADRVVQQNNMRTNRHITYNNETHTVAEWARILNVPSKFLFDRLRSNSFEHIVNLIASNII